MTNSTNIPIVIVAFGTASKAQDTYRRLDSKIQAFFPEHELFWAYSVKRINKELRENDTIHSPEDILNQLAAKGYDRAIVQSLHIFPATEFHALQRAAMAAPLQCSPGMPLLTSPGDYDFIAELLRPLIAPHLDQAVLLLAHGTNHPSWTCYLALENIMRQKFGETVFVGTIEKLPDSKNLPEKIAAQGFRKVFILPFLLVAGTHFFKDIQSESETSWEKRFLRLGLQVEIAGQGLGLLPGIERLIAAHISAAMDNHGF